MVGMSHNEQTMNDATRRVTRWIIGIRGEVPLSVRMPRQSCYLSTGLKAVCDPGYEAGNARYRA